MKKQYDVIIIGAGAAGMTAAVWAARGGTSVCVVEHRSEPGKKILQTGNGRCNLTHETVRGTDYACRDAAFAEFADKALARFNVEQTLAFFESIGIFTKNKAGYIYPYSGTALSVRNSLWDEMKRVGAELLTDTEPKISPSEDGFKVNVTTRRKKDGEEISQRSELSCKKLILATGLSAAPKTGSDGSGVLLAKAMGLEVNEVLPALVKLRVAGDVCKPASGVRHTARVSLFEGEKEIASDAGEVQFTDDGISGIPVFNVSRFASQDLYEGRSVMAVLDLLPDISFNECEYFLREHFDSMKARKVASFLGGLLPAKLLSAVARELGISADRRAGEVGAERLKELLGKCKEWELEVESCYGFESAQVCRGGVDRRLVDPETMQVKTVPGLYVAGELVDVDGPCGGYNLQWAWTSGANAGRSAAQDDTQGEYGTSSG